MLTALLVCMALLPDDGLGLEPPKGWKRSEDPQKRFVQYQPPNIPAGGDCTVIVYTPADFAGTAENYVDGMVASLTQGKRLLSPTTKTEVGIFKVAVINQQNAFGQVEIMVVHAVKAGPKAHAILFAANDPAFFKARTPEVLAMLNKAALPAVAAPEAKAPEAKPAGAEFAGMTIPFPAGFTRKDDPSGWIILTPPQNLARGNAVIYIMPTRKIEGSHWEAHRALLKGLVEQAKWPGSYADIADVAPGPFIRTVTHCSADARAMRLFTAVAGDQMEAIVCNPDASDELLRVLYEVFEKTTLKNAPAGGPKRPQVLEAFRRPAQKKYFNANGTYTLGRLMYERILLLDNGVADCSACYDEGFAASASLWKIDPGCLNGFYGKWTADGKAVRIKRGPEMAEQVYERENGALKFGDQEWRPMPRVDGLQLAGRWSSKSRPGDPLPFNYWFEFAADGTFKTGGGLTSLAVTDMLGRVKPPENATGTYEIRDWTIFFKIDGKVAWSGEDLKDLAILLLDTSGFTRE
jgi:hypothetical protein